ncbi:MAG: glycosyltransferase family 2 protein [Lachnospiraceae bacterium]|nr:glycosyltransferase family 2 protein [Lachnospiraceae bacterium]
MNRVIACIITFNPDIKRLERNIEAIKKQVEQIVIFDNASSNILEINKLLSEYAVTILEECENKGIAYGLNQCMEFARKNDYEWVITLDQDSICPLDIIKKSYVFLKRKDIAMIVPVIRESNSGEMCLLGDRLNKDDFQEVKKCITSGAITNVKVWEKVDGFDEGLFIDYVDYDFAMKVLLKKYKIIRMNKVLLDHQIGNSKYKNILGRKVRIANHSDFRKYYIARNMIIYIKRYWKNINALKEIMRVIKVLLLIIFFESNKRNKISAFLRGIKDGLIYRG